MSDRSPRRGDESKQQHLNRLHAEEDPHAAPLGIAVQHGWSTPLRTDGAAAQDGNMCWIQTTPDGIVHAGWARTYCGIELQWEHSVHGAISQATCGACAADFAASRLDWESWYERTSKL